ncbi:MAG: RnfABCDGE type electron transport complex subunit B [Muribaculaceae bacterium]|nr:RnfABCDGE type electron transport complex subunit B [Bacteroidales bacterium]MDE6242915.1 RnfABCDGE type electron transport complex subunit B [Muribaculaceae bacterium]
MTIFWLTILILGVVGLLAALVLYFVAKRFYVYEDPRIAEVEALLPGANCGGCGFKGCHDFAAACAGASSLEGLNCPGAGKAGMDAIGILLGLNVVAGIRKLAMLNCNGTCSLRPAINKFEGPRSCAIEAATYAGTTACPYGCLGCGDCVKACPHGAMRMDEETGLPVVDSARCTGCGVCVKACPRGLMQLNVAPQSYKKMVRVACSNHDRGPAAMKACEVSCIACGKCKKACESNSITIDNFCARIDSESCTRCGACVEVCPRKTILVSQIAEYQPKK